MTSFLPMKFNSTSLPESSSSGVRPVGLRRIDWRLKPFDPPIGARRPYFEGDDEFPEFLFDENIPPRRRKDRMDGSDTIMIATAISAMESTSTHLSDPCSLSFRVFTAYKRWSKHELSRLSQSERCSWRSLWRQEKMLQRDPSSGAG
jgi:hypothetical protein